ncbi:MAG TPA: DmsE family decaheme c-type cytochrome [Pyrinomonadaceae bacterium]|nr:DmsE family decaheme c-type cytochrome [Pyrinomonadaceae bacterium]
MFKTNWIKLGLLGSFIFLSLIWLFSATLSRTEGLAAESDPINLAAVPDANSDDYVGTETCKACHEDQFNSFAKTKHSKLSEVKSWKDKVQGCEQCHGPGRKHVEDPTVKGSIISFKDKDSKTISETCLTCHAGKESHNNFRRGEHWRNNVGCTDCHSVHPGARPDFKPDSNVLIGAAAEQRPNEADDKMLKQSEPQLCISCHSETKSQFQKPNHHKVLEGTMKCSDCHNAHGGFENKQTKLAVGADQACIKCHSNKQGPFVYEHAPLKLEGCTTCHISHGSSNAKMLKRATVRQLCLECHTGIIDELSETASVPSFHNQALVRYQQCTVCHSAIHGSNSSNVFFR